MKVNEYCQYEYVIPTQRAFFVVVKNQNGRRSSQCVVRINDNLHVPKSIVEVLEKLMNRSFSYKLMSTHCFYIVLGFI